MYIYIYYARNRTHVCLRGGAAACAPIPISHTSIYMPIHTYIKHIHTCIYIYIYIYHACIYIYIMRAIARTCACEAVQPHARPYLSLAQVFIYLYIYVCIFTMHAYIYIQI